MQRKVIAGALTLEGRIYVPEALRNEVIILFQNNPESGHLGALWTAKRISRDFHWLGLDTTVRKYVAQVWSIPLNQSTVPRTMWGYYTTISTIQPVEQNYYGLRHQHTGINQVKIQQDFVHSRRINEDGNLPTLPKWYRLTAIGMYVFRARDLQAWSTKQYWHRPQNAVPKPILNSCLLPHEHRPLTHDRLPSADRRPDRAAELEHGTIPLSHQQLRAEHLSRTLTSGRIRVQHLSAYFDKDDTVLGRVPLEPQDAVQSTKSITSTTRDPSGRYTQGIGRDSSDSPWEKTESPAAASKVCQWKRN